MSNQATGKQTKALAHAVLAYAENIENPAILTTFVEMEGEKHSSLNIQPKMYEIMGHHLLESIREVLGDLATSELIETWTVAYNQLADIMISKG